MMEMSLLWGPCKVCQQNCQMELLLKKTQKQQSNYTHKSLWGNQTGCLGGSAWGTDPKQLSRGVMCWNSIRINIALN